MREAGDAGVRARRERERSERRQEILRAACEVFARNGYYEATLDEIAREAAFGKGTIYNYFASKEELFDGLLTGMLDDLERIAAGAMETPGSVREKFAAYARALLSYAGAHSVLMHMVMRTVIAQERGSYQTHVKRLHDRAERIWGILAVPLENELEDEAVSRRMASLDALQLAGLFDTMLRYFMMHRSGMLRLTDPAVVAAQADSVVSLFFDGAARQNQSCSPSHH